MIGHMSTTRGVIEAGTRPPGEMAVRATTVRRLVYMGAELDTWRFCHRPSGRSIGPEFRLLLDLKHGAAGAGRRLIGPPIADCTKTAQVARHAVIPLEPQ